METILSRRNMINDFAINSVPVLVVSEPITQT